MRREPIVAAVALSALTQVAPAGAVVLSEDELEESSTEIGAVLRSFHFLLAGDVLAPPYAAEDTDPMGISSFDARLYFQYRTPELKLVAHEQLSLGLRSHSSASPLALGRGLSPPRWLPLDFQQADGGLSLGSQVDWLYGAYTVDPLTFTVGRQPITFGRGSLWRTTDRISTFTLTEVDTAYKPGADAVRIDLRAAEQTRLVAVAAIGEVGSGDQDLEADLQGSSFVGRFEQGWDGGELGVTGGLVRYDVLAGVDAVFDLGALDLYAELTLTKLTAESLGAPGVDGRDIPVPSALVGMTLKPSGTVTLKPEIHYNGFGSFEATDYLAIAVSDRTRMGEQVALGRLYAGWTSDWELHPLTHLSQAMIVNLHDPSALVFLALRHNLADDVDVAGGVYAPIGTLPDVAAVAARSEYGSYPYFFFTELKGTI